jgi:hypothetical protein
MLPGSHVSVQGYCCEHVERVGGNQGIVCMSLFDKGCWPACGAFQCWGRDAVHCCIGNSGMGLSAAAAGKVSEASTAIGAEGSDDNTPAVLNA